jgi:hypothetical protein
MQKSWFTKKLVKHLNKLLNRSPSQVSGKFPERWLAAAFKSNLLAVVFICSAFYFLCNPFLLFL